MRRKWFARPAQTWVLLAPALLAMALAPLGLSFFVAQPDVWSHLRQHVLPEAILQTALLVAGVLTGTFLIGTAAAGLVAVFDFPGRTIFARLLILPLAIPGYIYAFVYIGLFDFSGPIQSFLREQVDLDLSGFLAIRSTGGLILVMSLALYPYVYLLAKAAFETHNRNLDEAALSLGLNRFQVFRRVLLPLARPHLAAGLALVAMETLADFGTVATFNYTTLTTAVYRTWFGLFSWEAAAQLSCFLILVVAVAFGIEKRALRQRQFHAMGPTPGPRRHRLRGLSAALATFGLGTLAFCAFGLPLGQLAVWALHEGFSLSRLGPYIQNTLWLSSGGAALIVAVALVLSLTQRALEGYRAELWIRFTGLGYALPGVVLAVGVLSLLRLLGIASAEGTGVALVALFLAYLLRFVALGLESVRAATRRIHSHLDEAARSLGSGSRDIFWRVHLPILRRGLGVAATLAFVELAKEMPMTLMTRPFGWDTLAVRVFQFTSEGLYATAAAPALVMITLAIGPTLLVESWGRAT